MRWVDADDDLDDAEYPDEPFEDEEDDETISCPHCFRPVHDDAERCPGCGVYLSREDAPRRHPWWMIVGVVLCLVVIYGWIVH